MQSSIVRPLATLFLSLSLCSACHGDPPAENQPAPRSAAAPPVSSTGAVSQAESNVAVPTTAASNVAVSAAIAPNSAVRAAAAKVAAPTIAGPGASAVAPSALSVKRFVVGSGVKDREPLLSEEPLVGNGAPIYAFAEVSNVDGESENVRVTFERRGGRERVGDVSLPVPRNVTRHRTWAFTRFIRVPGVWEAVLWSETGVELSRTSFEVTAG